jgi:WD40 repeat protein
MRSALLATVALLVHTLQAQVVAEPAAKEIKCSKAQVTYVSVSPKGDKLLVGLYHGAELFDLHSGKKLYTFPFSEDESNVVYYAAFNDNGEFVVLIGFSGKRQVYDVKTGRQVKELHEHRWIPDPRATKAMGLQASNSAFDRFYQQGMAGRDGILTARSQKAGEVEFVDDEGAVMQILKLGVAKDPHHRAPCLFHDAWFITGTEDGRVLLYTLR